ncbi:MAG TPA: protocatechuate 3,4-dioxygenase [Fimbriiglobus sp.]
MTSPLFVPSRRLFIGSAAFSAAMFTVRGAFADELVKTPKQTEGPFYPNKLPLDTDNDLIVVNDGLTPAVGEITNLYGKVMDEHGNPIKNALVEIWQCDAKGVYIHTKDSEPKKDRRDKNFQGFGRFLTGSTGEYYFRTIKPVPYPGRAPHIHFKIKQGRKELLVSQCYIKGYPGNAKDGVYNGIKDLKARESVTIAFTPVKESKVGELNAKFDLVLGVTPAGH